MFFYLHFLCPNPVLMNWRLFFIYFMFVFVSHVRVNGLIIRFGVTICAFFHLWSQVAIMAQGGFALLKQIAAAHLGNAVVQEPLWWAVCNLAGNADNKVH